VIRLIATDDTVTLGEGQVSRVKFLLLESLPARRCSVDPGPGVEIVVSDRDRYPDDVAPGILSRLEAIVGCPLRFG
jgi:hypothetical protein